jgi:hypothetical protein
LPGALPLECGNVLRHRLVLLRIESLLAPHHEIGGVCAERRYCERRGKKNGLLARRVPPEFLTAHLSQAALRRSGAE